MVRKPRKYQIEQSLVFHVINRGILKQTIFHDEEDFYGFIDIISFYLNKENAKIYHWCFMDNHYHIVMELAKPERLSKLVGAWQQVYAVRYHKKYNTAGKLFQGRFKSQAIDMERYLLACGRYVEQNPIRAGICKHAWQWQMSSARFYVEGKQDKITTKNPFWVEVNGENYRQFLEEISEADLKLFKGNEDVIGDRHFHNSLILEKGRMKHRGQGRRPGKIIE